MENAACQMDVARLTRRVHDLADEVSVYDRRIARQETQIETLQTENDNLQRRNSGLWLINAGLRHDLTAMIVGEEDSEMIAEVMREAEKEEWEELSGETLVERSSGSESHAESAKGTDGENDIDRQFENEFDAMTEETSDIVDEAETAMTNFDGW